MTHLGSITPLVLEAAKIRKAISDKVLGLPDNRMIDRSDTRCFTINSKQLDSNLTLSPEFYDFKHQYSVIAQAMIEVPIENTVDWFNRLIKKGSIKVKGNTIRLHPEVIQHIESIL